MNYNKDKDGLREFLNQKVKDIQVPNFINDDPISIPKKYESVKDVEITAFWTAMLSWGQRKTIINKSTELFGLMGKSPYEFILNHKEKDRQRFESFKHRTFQYTDTLYFLEFLQHYYRNNESLEDIFSTSETIKEGIINFQELFFSLPDAPQRTRKHVATPQRKSTCKRINMYLRWMVRSDKNGVDFGIWKNVKTSKLMIPLDVHVERVGRSLGLLERKQRDWKAVEELTSRLQQLDPNDPVKYDYALFGLGVLGLY